MGRALVEAALFFLSPFVAYAAWLVLRRRYPLQMEHWSGGKLSGLVLAGLLAAVIGVFWLGLSAQRHQGVYFPARVEKGKLVPGHIE